VCAVAAISFLIGSRHLPEDLRRFQTIEEVPGQIARAQSA